MLLFAVAVMLRTLLNAAGLFAAVLGAGDKLCTLGHAGWGDALRSRGQRGQPAQGVCLGYHCKHQTV